jgi:hypothetical protein
VNGASAVKTATSRSSFFICEVKTMTKRKKPSKGELNKVVDTLVHPYFKQYPALIVVDGIVHGLIEQDLRTSIPKFVRYNAALILKELMKKPKRAR